MKIVFLSLFSYFLFISCSKEHKPNVQSIVNQYSNDDPSNCRATQIAYVKEKLGEKALSLSLEEAFDKMFSMKEDFLSGLPRCSK